MTNKKPNFIMQFDGKKYSKSEQKILITEFIISLMKLSSKQEAKKFKTGKEQKEYEQNFTNFGLKALQHLSNSQNKE
ncbi:MAG: hypothetical protein LUG16_03805 [Candidatus Gastranaerophilales bacterium]|nr:hypothetical protein [Candidatus Gastranaerophilales bacterium]